MLLCNVQAVQEFSWPVQATNSFRVLFRGCAMMRRSVGLMMAVLGAAIVGLSVSAAADDKADPTGTWKWSFQRQDGEKIENTLKLKMKDGKLTGHLIGRNNQEVEIKEGKFKNGEVSFQITREFGGQEVTIKYKGKLEKDTIKGKTEFERDGEKRERDWEAKRVKEKEEKK
jgi:major membrane immunogen (membrane-anchored lipoprotein)